MPNLYRIWSVKTGSYDPFPMILPEAVIEAEALAAARERWPDSEVTASGVAEDDLDMAAISADCVKWLRELTRPQIVQRLNRMKPALREAYRAELNRVRKLK